MFSRCSIFKVSLHAIHFLTHLDTATSVDVFSGRQPSFLHFVLSERGTCCRAIDFHTAYTIRLRIGVSIRTQVSNATGSRDNTLHNFSRIRVVRISLPVNCRSKLLLTTSPRGGFNSYATILIVNSLIHTTMMSNTLHFTSSFVIFESSGLGNIRTIRLRSRNAQFTIDRGREYLAYTRSNHTPLGNGRYNLVIIRILDGRFNASFGDNIVFFTNDLVPTSLRVSPRGYIIRCVFRQAPVSFANGHRLGFCITRDGKGLERVAGKREQLPILHGSRKLARQVERNRVAITTRCRDNICQPIPVVPNLANDTSLSIANDGELLISFDSSTIRRNIGSKLVFVFSIKIVEYSRIISRTYSHIGCIRQIADHGIILADSRNKAYHF